MKIFIYALVLLFGSVSFVKGQTEVYKGQVSVKQNNIERRNNVLFLDMDISLCGLSVGLYQSLMLMPMLRHGQDSLLLKPIVVNGRNKQKMYKRAQILKGENAAHEGIYTVIKNEPSLIQQISYKETVPYASWMKGAQLVLVGELGNYDGEPLQIFINVLTDKLQP